MEKDSPFSSTGRRCIVTLMCIFVTAFVYAQQQKISVSIKELPLKEAISQIAEKALMNVAYSKEFVDTSRKVSLEVKDTDVSKALTLLLKGTNIGSVSWMTVFYFIIKNIKIKLNLLIRKERKRNCM